MQRSSMDMSATFGAKVEHVVAESQDVLSLNVKCGAVGCIINGSCKLEHEGASRIIPERRLYVIDNHTQHVEHFTNHEGLFEQVLLRISDDSVAGMSDTNRRERERFDNAILQGIVSNLSIEELANMCYYSVSTFKRRFIKLYHLPPHKWMLRCRLMLAAQIMQKADISISDVSSLCGFVNVSHFIATFRRHFDTTPSHLKHHNRHGELQ